jgi:signal transduction histidine kinase
MQEALNNIIKHAQASTIHIQLSRSKGFVLLKIQDNGQGFAPDKVRKGLGLNNIRNRAELFGGNVTIKTAPGAGCTLNVMVPDRCTANLF